MAGDESDAGVSTKELAAVLQAMDEKYRLLFDVICKQSENSKTEAETKEDVHPLQMPLVKLEGADNYSSWSEHAETILVSRKSIPEASTASASSFGAWDWKAAWDRELA